MDLDIGTFLRSERLPAEYRGQIDAFWTDLARAIVARRNLARAPIVIGICGAQGSGKSTLAKLLKLLIEADGALRAEHLSLDDLYLSRAERRRLATDVHPLLATRGVPGTHDVALGIRTIDALTSGDAGTSVALPTFDKATDDRVAPSLWSQVSAPVDIILFDTGPIPGSVESLFVTSVADAVILVVRRGESQSRFNRSVSYLRMVGAEVAGTVFNGAARQSLSLQSASGADEPDAAGRRPTRRRWRPSRHARPSSRAPEEWTTGGRPSCRSS